MRIAIINSETNKVVNVCKWEGKEWLPPKGTFIVEDTRVNIGDEWNPETETIVYIDRTASDPEPEEEE